MRLDSETTLKRRRTLMWKFEIEYQHCSLNYFADTMSRHPSQYAEQASSSTISSEVTDEVSLIGGVIGAETEMFFSITYHMKTRKISLGYR